MRLAGKHANLETLLDPDWEEMLTDADMKAQINHNGYAMLYCWNGVKMKREFLHRLITNSYHIKNKVVDHINGNRLDNRRANLRVVTHSENNLNRNNKLNRKNTSGTNGLYIINTKGRKTVYRNTFILNRKIVFQRDFKTLEEAKLFADFHNNIRDL